MFQPLAGDDDEKSPTNTNSSSTYTFRSSPSDFLIVLLICKRLNNLGLHPLVLSNAGSETLAVRAKNWCDEAHRFLKLCLNADNKEACYTLGMIRFHCLQQRGSGASLMARAAIQSHAPTLYSLALIQFNGSGGMKNYKDLRLLNTTRSTSDISIFKSGELAISLLWDACWRCMASGDLYANMEDCAGGLIKG